MSTAQGLHQDNVGDLSRTCLMITILAGARQNGWIRWVATTLTLKFSQISSRTRLALTSANCRMCWSRLWFLVPIFLISLILQNRPIRPIFSSSESTKIESKTEFLCFSLNATCIQGSWVARSHHLWSSCLGPIPHSGVWKISQCFNTFTGCRYPSLPLPSPLVRLCPKAKMAGRSDSRDTPTGRKAPCQEVRTPALAIPMGRLWTTRTSAKAKTTQEWGWSDWHHG